MLVGKYDEKLPVLYGGGSQQDEVALDGVVGLGELLVAVLQGQLGAAQEMAHLLVLDVAQLPVGHAQCPQTLL